MCYIMAHCEGCLQFLYVDSFLARTKMIGQPVLCGNVLELMSKLLLESFDDFG